ncbi:hypothetical protein [Chachezhania sediminis]|uniref:hypothetical protein n=1 Tax=Chachezhania sediminis TaxID=2599291 RepID=UPI00131BE5EF|nr:hypothetical protein [Chachezhania sediminis]
MLCLEKERLTLCPTSLNDHDEVGDVAALEQAERARAGLSPFGNEEERRFPPGVFPVLAQQEAQ